MTDKPNFRFFPKSYEVEGVFSKSDEICEACGKPSVWLYVGSIYTEGDPRICARCISDGSLDAFLGEKKYGFQDSLFPNADNDLRKEVLCRTPGVISFNPVDWPVIDSKPLSFFGYGDDEETWKTPAAVEAMKLKWREYAGEELEGQTSYLLVFKELDGPKYVAVLDLD
jgi:uncharacterized protein CbrC (UPF0167 family)